LTETRVSQQASIFSVCDLPYLAQNSGLQPCSLEKLHGDFAGYDTKLLCIRSLEQETKGVLLLWGEVENRRI
jgi:hypothetical protein